MIAKAKAISHGKAAIEYVLRESKNSEFLESNLIQNLTHKEIHQEFIDISKYNSRCKNKFIRIEIGIAPKDQNLSNEQLIKISNEFSKRFGFENHQWIACSHRDTDNLHMHMIVNRIGVDQKVFDTSFISKKAGIIAEKISRDMGLTIASEVQSKQKKKHHDVINFERMFARAKIERFVKSALNEKPTTLEAFKVAMEEKGVTVEEVINKKGKTYGLRFTGFDETFKGSAISKEFGHYSLLTELNSNLKEMMNESMGLNHSSNQSYSGAARSSNILSTVGAMTNGGQSDENMMENEKENKKQSKKIRYVRR